MSSKAYRPQIIAAPTRMCWIIQRRYLPTIIGVDESCRASAMVVKMMFMMSDVSGALSGGANSHMTTFF